MTWTEDTKKEIQEKSKTYLSAAKEGLESAIILLEHEKYYHSCLLLKQALNQMVDGFLTIYSIELDGDRTEQLKSLQQKEALFKEQWITTLQDIFKFDKQTLENKSTFQKYNRLAEESQKMFYVLEHRFYKMLRNELATQEELEKFAKQKKQLIKRSMFIVGAIVVCLIGAYIQFLVLQPFRYFYDQGQVFWLSSQVTEYSESHQRKFRFLGNNEFSEVDVTLLHPTKMTQLRLDPSMVQLQEIEIDWITLVGADDTPLLRFDFNAEDPEWKRVNASSPNAPNGTWIIEPKNHDPYIISNTFNEIEVHSVKIKIRYRDPLPFIDWVLGINPALPSLN